MKKILMLTDFSKNADHVAKTAAKVVPQLKADILLYHTYYNHPTISRVCHQELTLITYQSARRHIQVQVTPVILWPKV